MAKLLASSQITIVDLNDAVSLRSYIGCSHPRVQYLNNNGTYVPDYSHAGHHVILSADLSKIGDNTNLVLHPSTVVSRVDWYVKLAPSQEYVKITPQMSEYELIGTSPFFSGLKIKSNIMNNNHPGVTFKTEVDFKENWMPEVHTQITEIDLTLTIQGNDGADAYTAILTNPTHTIICNHDGTADVGEIGLNGRAYSNTIAYKGTDLLTAVNDNPSKGQYSIKIESENCTAIKKDSDTFYINTLVNPTANVAASGKLESEVLNSAKNLSNGGKVKVIFNFEGQSEVKQLMTFSKVYNGTNGVDGNDGADGESAKYITLTLKEGSTIFKYDKNSANPNVSKAVLEASIFNVNNPTYKWSYYANGSWTLINGQTSKSLTVNATDAYFNAANSITFRCTVKDTLSDEITITKLMDGNDSIVVQQSNESHVIACNHDGSFKDGESERAINEITAYRGLNKLTLTTSTPSTGQYKITIDNNSDVTYQLNNNVIKITGMTADAAALIINVNCEGVIYKKVMSLSKAKDGKQGKNSYIAVLTNEYHSLPATATGNITSYAGCSSSIELYKGHELITEGVTYSALPSSGVVGNMSGNTFTVSGLTQDTGNVTLKAQYNGITYSKIFSIAKNKQGINGVDSTSYWLLSSATSISKNNNGQLNPSSVVYEAKSQTGAQALVAYAGRFKIYKSTDGTNFGTAIYTSSSNESRKEFSVPSDARAIKCELYLTDGTTSVDTQTISVVSDGRDGIDGTDAAYVKISGEQTFKYGPNFIGIPTPSSITVSRTLYNTIGGKWQYNNGSTWVDFVPAQTGATLEVTPTIGHFATSSNKVMRIRYIINNNMYDEMSIVKLADGQSGTNAFTVILSNPSHTVNANYQGIVSNLNSATTDIIVYKGTNTIAPTSVTEVSKVPSNAAFSITQATGSSPAKITMTNFPNNADAATCTVNIVVEGQTIKQTFSVTKAKQGTPGSSAKTVFISGNQIFKYPKGATTPEGGTTITLTAVESNFTGTNRKWYADGTIIQGQTGTNLVINHTGSYWGNKTFVVFKYVADGIYDEMTVSKLYDGSDTYSVILTNESQVLAANSNGVVSSSELSKARTKVRVFKGMDELTAGTTLAAGKFTITTSESLADGSGTCSYIKKESGDKADNDANVGIVLTGFNQSKDSGQVPLTIKIEKNSNTVNKIFSFSKSKAGATGNHAKVIQITGGSSIIQKKDGSYAPSNGIVLTALKKNITSGTIQWIGDGVPANITGDSYTVPVSSFNNRKTVTIRAQLSTDASVYDIHTISKVTDGTDAITSYIWGPNGTLINNNNMKSLDVEAVIMSGSSNISTSSDVSYHWEKKVGDHWVNLKGTNSAPIAGNNNGNKITVTQEEIPGMLVVRCTMKKGTVTQTDSIVLEDRNDPVQAIIFSTAGQTFKNGVGETYLVAKTKRNGVDMDSMRLVQNIPSEAGVQGEVVYVKSKSKYYKYNNSTWEELKTIPSAGDNSTYTYKWTKADADGNLISGWSRTGKVIYISSEDIDEKAIFMVDVEG